MEKGETMRMPERRKGNVPRKHRANHVRDFKLLNGRNQNPLRATREYFVEVALFVAASVQL